MVTALIIVVLAISGALAGENVVVQESTDLPVVNDFNGPDLFGYRWIDSDESWGPEYEWVDISEIGTEIITQVDEYNGPYYIGFSFPFYNNTYETVGIVEDGCLVFDTDIFSPVNMMIPYNRSPNNFIAILWNNLGISPYDMEGYGHIYYYYDEPGNRFIVSYEGVPLFWHNGALNFQAILYPDGKILLQYGSMDPGEFGHLEQSTIGIENIDGTDGLEIAYWEEYIHDNMAILIYPEPLLDYDVMPRAFTAPIGVLQVSEPFAPVVTFDNMGAQSASFDVSLTISFNDAIVYAETQIINDLESNAITDITFPEYAPITQGTYILTAVSSLVTDENNFNDTLTVDFEVWAEFLPPIELSTANDQNNVVPLHWYEPGTPPCTLLAYDDGNCGAGFYDSDNLHAMEFEALPPIQVCTVFVHVPTAGDAGWGEMVYPVHDSVQIKVFDDAGDGSPGNMLADITDIANYGEWIFHVFDPPIIIETEKFWVSFNNISDSQFNYDFLGQDRRANHIAKMWWRDEADIWHHEPGAYADQGDMMIRASIRTHTINTVLTINDPDPENPLIASTLEADFLGYNIYRDTQPNVDITESNRIVEQTTETSYNDEDVSNGTTYYYAVTAAYDTGDEIVESEPAIEVSATPASGGQLVVDRESIQMDTTSGDIYTTQLTLTNDGDLDVDFTIMPTTINNINLERRAADVDYLERPNLSAGQTSLSYNADDLPRVMGYNGPDEFGYVWIDSDEIHGPEYSWVSPALHQELNLNTLEITGPLQLEFEFPFYGQMFNSLYVSSTGYISFTDSELYPRGSGGLLPGIPNEDLPKNVVAPFWSDFNLNVNESSKITWYADDDMAVITWSDLNYMDLINFGPYYTFQVILYSDGRILFQYEDMQGPVASMITGIQNGTGEIASQVAYCDNYAYSGLATLIQMPWLYAEPASGTVPAGSQITVDINLDATSLDPRIYQGNLYIASNDVNIALDPISVPVTLDLQTGIFDDHGNELPTSYNLAHNYPNPFNAQTLIEFALPHDSDVELVIYNMLGQEVDNLVSGRLGAGRHSAIWDASDVSSGIYFYKIQAGEFTETQKMLLIK